MQSLLTEIELTDSVVAVGDSYISRASYHLGTASALFLCLKRCRVHAIGGAEASTGADPAMLV